MEIGKRKLTIIVILSLTLILFVLTVNHKGDNHKVDKLICDFSIFPELQYSDMVAVEGGTFMMGAQSESQMLPNYDSEVYGDESPIHQVTLDDFYIGKYEVTERLWRYVMSYNGITADGSAITPCLSDNQETANYLPVVTISYDDIVNIFLPRLNKITGKQFRLPTEAEWEYAARGGRKSQGYKYSGSNNVDDVAWYWDNSPYTTHQVGTKQPNELGLYDMSGNVNEWCSDWYSYSYYSSSPTTNPTGPTTGSYRVLRGGSWYDLVQFCRVSNHSGYSPDYRVNSIGFRLAHSLK